MADGVRVRAGAVVERDGARTVPLDDPREPAVDLVERLLDRDLDVAVSHALPRRAQAVFADVLVLAGEPLHAGALPARRRHARPVRARRAVGGYLSIRVRGSARREVVERLLERDDVPAVATTIGVYDLVAFLGDRSAADLSAAVDEIRASTGVRAVDVSLMTDHVFTAPISRGSSRRTGSSQRKREWSNGESNPCGNLRRR